MRLNKYISHNTKYSRREADKLIERGIVKIGRKIATDFSYQVEKDDKVFIGQKPIIRKNKFTVLVYNKKKGELVTKKDDRERQVIFDSLPKRFGSFLPVGRLDFASEGLILLTDSPSVATRLMQSNLERVYYLRVKGEISELAQNAMKEGIFLEDATKGAFKDTKIYSMQIKPFLWFNIIKNRSDYSTIKLALNEGQNRELRRFFAYFENEVVQLKRLEFGGVELGMLKDGKHRFLTTNEYENLRKYLKDIATKENKIKRAKQREERMGK